MAILGGDLVSKDPLTLINPQCETVKSHSELRQTLLTWLHSSCGTDLVLNCLPLELDDLLQLLAAGEHLPLQLDLLPRS